MSVPKEKENDTHGLSEQEIAQKRDEIVKRMLNTPPRLHRNEPKRRKRKDTHDGTRT